MVEMTESCAKSPEPHCTWSRSAKAASVGLTRSNRPRRQLASPKRREKAEWRSAHADAEMRQDNKKQQEGRALT